MEEKTQIDTPNPTEMRHSSRFAIRSLYVFDLQVARTSLILAWRRLHVSRWRGSATAMILEVLDGSRWY